MGGYGTCCGSLTSPSKAGLLGRACNPYPESAGVGVHTMQQVFFIFDGFFVSMELRLRRMGRLSRLAAHIRYTAGAGVGVGFSSDGL